MPSESDATPSLASSPASGTRRGKTAAPRRSTRSALATSMRVRNGKRRVTEGPFAGTREPLGGDFPAEAKDLDQAIAIAGRIPGASKATVEIRPVLAIAGLPPEQGVSGRGVEPTHCRSAHGGTGAKHC